MSQRVVHGEADTPRARLHWAEIGQAGDPVVLLLHGWPQTWLEWRDVMPRLAASGYRVLAPDLTGLGDSGAAGDGDYRKRAIAGDVAALLDQLGVRRCALVAGHDWGGPVGFALAAWHPAVVERLAVVDVPIPGDGREGGLSAGGTRWHHLFHRTPRLPEALTAGRERLYLDWFFDEYAEDPAACPPAARAEYASCYSRLGAMARGFDYYRATELDAADNAAFLGAQGRLRLPVLGVAGGAGRGRGAEVEASLGRVATAPECHVLPGCGHLVPEERPHELAELLLAFTAERIAEAG